MQAPIAAIPDFHALFDATPSPYLVLAKDFSIASVNQAYLRVTKTYREEILGRNIFDVFPDNPHDPAASGVAKLQASLLRVLQNKCADTMAIQKYDLPVSGPGGITFEERYWSPINTPVLDANGEVIHIIHCVEDVTDFVKARDRTASMESKIDDQALEIEIANRRLREANEELQQRVVARTKAQRQTKQKLRESELRFRLMADSIPQMVWMADAAGRATFFNQQWANYTGKPTGQLDAEEVAESFIHPDDEAPRCRLGKWH